MKFMLESEGEYMKLLDQLGKVSITSSSHMISGFSIELRTFWYPFAAHAKYFVQYLIEKNCVD